MADVPVHILFRRSRKDLGITQKALAERIGVSQATYSAYETARERIPKGRLLEIADALNSPWWKPFQRGRQHDHTAVGI